MPRKSKQVNIRLVAEEAGVSLASVSRVLNNHPDVSESLRRQVLAVVEKNNFTPDKSVERLLRISVVVGVGDITDYVATILTGMGLAANTEGIELSIQRCSGRLPLLRACRLWRSSGDSKSITLFLDRVVMIRNGGNRKSRAAACILARVRLSVDTLKFSIRQTVDRLSLVATASLE